jgi:hypothetical protein
MIEPELQNHLLEINKSLTEIKNKKKPGIWRAFFNGMFSAFGYVVGIALVIVIIGWILNKTGLLPAFREQVKDFQVILQGAKQLMVPAEQQPQQGSGAQGSYQITLPDGQVINVNR